ncbi:MAG: dTMP kinase [Pseudomonadota bacterium]
MIVIDGMDGAGKGVQTRRLKDTLLKAGHRAILTREPGGSPGAEEIRRLLVEGDPDKWDAMTELLLMYAARRSHLVKTVWPALAEHCWVISDRFADSSRAFQGIAGELGLDVVEAIHQISVGTFKPDLTIILDLPVAVALERAKMRGGGEDRFERKGVSYHERVRSAFIEIAQSDTEQYVLLDGSMPMDQVTAAIADAIKSRLGLDIKLNQEVG